MALPRIPIEQRFWTKVDPTGECWLWTASLHPKGYGQVSVRRPDGRPTMRRAHHIAWELTYGPKPPHLFVLHHCDTPRCVRPDHLFLGTQADNIADMVRKGRHRFGRRANIGI